MAKQITDTSEARRHLDRLRADMEQLARSNLAAEDFFPRFLQRLSIAVGAQAVAVWKRDGNQVQPETEFGLAQIGLVGNAAALSRNQPLLAEVLGSGQTTLKHPDLPGGDQLPVRLQIVTTPLQQAGRCVGAIQVFQSPTMSPPTRAGFLQFIEEMGGIASQYLDRRSSLAPLGVDGLQTDGAGAQLMLALHRSRQLKEVAAVAANDGRLCLGVDRMSVIIRRGRKTETLAVSGQQRVNRRSNLARAMERLAESVIKAGEPLVYDGEARELPPTIAGRLKEYLAESQVRFALFYPLYEPRPLGEKKEDAEQRPAQKAFACVVVEHMRTGENSQHLQQQVAALAEHLAVALDSARSQARIFLLPVWRGIGSGMEWFRGRKLLKTLAIAACLALVVAILWLIPWEYRVAAAGRLMPAEQQSVFAPWDGEVVNIHVRGGQRVSAGDVLLEMRNEQLEEEWNRMRNELLTKKKRVGTLKAQVDEMSRDFQQQRERTRLQGELMQTLIEIDGLTLRVEDMEERRKKLIVKAGISGVVATFQLDQKLRNRPVARGDVLVEIMNEEGPWRLELNVPDDRLGHLFDGMEKRGTQRLPVDFILATRPESTFSGSVESVATRTETVTEEGLIVPVLVAIDRPDLPEEDCRIGAEVRGKIQCGKRSLGYCIFGDVLEFLQQRLW
jgi:multidrug efflux pump subunit AcrA (membrane-fusion protein)